MKRSLPSTSASASIDHKIAALGDWRGETLARVRAILCGADPEIIEEWKWGIPVWSREGIVCTGETYKKAVKMTFAKGAALKDPQGLFNSSLEGNVRRAIDLHEGDAVDAAALTALVREAVAFNLATKSKARAKTSPATKAPAASATASVKKGPMKKAPVKKAPAKKAPAKKAPAKKAIRKAT
jgi:hypothetical protein